MEPEPTSFRKNLLALLAALVILLGAAALALHYCTNQKIALLNPHPGAEWIIYSKPPDGGGLYRTTEISTVFLKEFKLAQIPANASLSLRAMKRWEMSVNGRAVAYVPPPDGNWKNAATVEIASKLHPGTNRIEITVFNSNGPPALWLHQNSGPLLDGDPTWQASMWQAEWKPARLAAARPEFPPHGLLDGGEHPWASFLKSLPALFLFALLSAGALWFGRRWRHARPGQNTFVEAKAGWLLAGFALLLWIALYLNNLGILPYQFGFDAYDHLKYIDYIRTKWKLPFANEGWQMYQPPLYHFISALLLEVFQAGDSTTRIAAILRAFGCAIGAANFLFIFLTLRLLLPGRPGAQGFGLLLAAFVAENLYISQFISNEALCGTLTSGAFYVCVRILTTGSLSPKWHAALGLLLGAALLAKFTALLAFPLVGAALAFQLLRAKNFPVSVWLKTIGVTFLAAFAVCGWHYVRVWRHFGSPLVGNWDAASGYSWWMEDGYHTPGYFFRFGRCLQYPWFSAFDGFADGLYSTLWGDGLWGGMTSYPDRPPWNYDLMAAGYLLALVPTALILAGAALAVKKTVRPGNPSWAMLTLMAGGTFAALALMCLKVPTYGSAKAFYGLVALLPLCAFGALGWDAFWRRSKFAGYCLACLAGVWALNSYAACWVRRTPENYILLGRLQNYDGHDDEARRNYAIALSLAPTNSRALSLVGGLNPDPAQALALLKNAVALNPADAEAHSQLARGLDEQGQPEAALLEDRQAIALAPSLTAYHLVYSEHLFALKRYEETIAAATRGLGCSPLSFKLHYGIGLALEAQGKYPQAVTHLEHAASMDPGWAEARDQLGASLTAVGRLQEALTNFYQAVRLQPTNADFIVHLAGAFSATGDTTDAVAQYERALQLNPDHPAALNNLAWIRAANADAGVRDGAEALRLARHANELADGKITVLLGTLAAAYAEAGQFPEAIATARQAIAQAEANHEPRLADTNRKLLGYYLANRAYHEDLPLEPSGGSGNSGAKP